MYKLKIELSHEKHSSSNKKYQKAFILEIEILVLEYITSHGLILTYFPIIPNNNITTCIRVCWGVECRVCVCIIYKYTHK